MTISDELINNLQAELDEAVEEERFEKAADLLRRITRLKRHKKLIEHIKINGLNK
jgi:protein-arginine kinase activator protein McsA